MVRYDADIKKLIEVAMPLEAINAASVREINSPWASFYSSSLLSAKTSCRLYVHHFCAIG